MITKQRKPPTTQRAFGNVWIELDYLCQKARYWLYSRSQKVKAERYADRLERVLSDLPESDMAILREEGLALLHEIRGDIDKAISHRKREIQLMERLHVEACTKQYTENTRAYMLRDRDVDALEERRAILETLKKAKADLPGRHILNGRGTR
ncbi:MAG TPA: hypothetical protein VE988_08825 [Gemmataceae bacterium]|nr:hypothetical protein [Gemmataceae bacterium]